MCDYDGGGEEKAIGGEKTIRFNGHEGSGEEGGCSQGTCSFIWCVIGKQE